MSKRLKFLLNLISLRYCYFLRPFWSLKEWKSVVQFLTGETFPEAAPRLEEKVVQLTGSHYALAVNLGRSAIQLALEAFHFPRGREVILPSFSCTGVIMPVIQAGLQPVLGDVDQDFNLRAGSVREGLSDRTCAVILPHLSGKFSRDTADILALAKDHGVKVIEDACQSFGLQWKGRWAGTFGDVGIFSFGPGKNLPGPGGGMLVTDNKQVATYCQSRLLSKENFRSIRSRVGHFVWHLGWQPWTYPMNFIMRYIREPFIPSFSVLQESLETYAYPVYRISDIESLLALCQIECYQKIIMRRQASARALLDSGVLREVGLELPEPTANIFSKFLVTTGLDEKEAIYLRQRLQSCGIETESSYRPLHLRVPFQEFRRTSMPETERRWRGAFSIPVNPRLGPKDMKRIIRILRNCEARNT